MAPSEQPLEDERSHSPPGGRGTLAHLSGSALVAGLLVYALLVMCGRALTPAQFSQFLAFWGVLFGLAAVASSLEQEVSRQSASIAGRGRHARRDVLRTCVVGLTIVGALVVPLFIGVTADLMLAGQRHLGPVAALAVLGHAVQHCVRGFLLGSGRPRLFVILQIGEAGIRAAAAFVLSVLGLATVWSLALATASGAFAWLLVFPFSRQRQEPTLCETPEPDAAEERSTQVAKRVAQLMLGTAFIALLVTGYPSLVTSLAPELRGEALGTLFAALTIARTPLLAVAAIQLLVVTAVVRMQVEPDGGARLRLVLARGALVALVLTGLAAVMGLIGGPWSVRLLYGADYDAGPWVVGGLAASTILVGSLLLLSAVLVALVAHTWVPLVWGVASSSCALFLWGGPGSAETRAVAALLVGPLVALPIAFLVAVSRSRRVG